MFFEAHDHLFSFLSPLSSSSPPCLLSSPFSSSPPPAQVFGDHVCVLSLSFTHSLFLSLSLFLSPSRLPLHLPLLLHHHLHHHLLSTTTIIITDFPSFYRYVFRFFALGDLFLKMFMKFSSIFRPHDRSIWPPTDTQTFRKKEAN